MSKDIPRRRFLTMTLGSMATAVITSGLSAEEKKDFVPFSTDFLQYNHISDIIPSMDLPKYFPLIVESCNKELEKRDLYIPWLPELISSLYWRESRMERFNYSLDGAAGLPQLMEETAKGLGLVVNGNSELPNYESKEKMLDEAKSKYTEARQKYLKATSDLGGRVDEIISESGQTYIEISSISSEHELYVKSKNELGNAKTNLDKADEGFKKTKEKFMNYPSDMEKFSDEKLEKTDQRFIPKYAIPASIKLFLDYYEECMGYFGGSVDMNVWRAVSAYNCGIGRSKKWYGFPFIEESVNHARIVVLDLSLMWKVKEAYVQNRPEVASEILEWIRDGRDAYNMYPVIEEEPVANKEETVIDNLIGQLRVRQNIIAGDIFNFLNEKSDTTSTIMKGFVPRKKFSPYKSKKAEGELDYLTTQPFIFQPLKTAFPYRIPDIFHQPKQEIQIMDRR